MKARDNNFGTRKRIGADLSAEKQAPQSVVSRWFLRTGSMEEVRRRPPDLRPPAQSTPKQTKR